MRNRFKKSKYLAFRPIKRHILVGIAIGVIILVSAGAITIAAIPRPTGTIVVTTYDITSGTRQTMGGVDLRVNSLNYPLECSDSTKTTNALTGSNHGRATFVNCPAGSTIANRKYQKYVVISASKSGYQLSPRSPFKIGADKAASKGGSFAVRKKRKTFVRLYFIREGARAVVSPQPPSPPAGGGAAPSPNANQPTPCGMAYLPPLTPLNTSEVIASVINPSHCHKKDQVNVS